MERVHSGSQRVGDRSLLSAGFVALATAVLVARSSPATGYELSLYTNTPGLFWALFGCSILTSLVVLLRTPVRWIRGSAFLLSGATVAVFVGLPIVRGYRFFGAGDALTHLGWMRGIRSGAISPFELEYPALHTIANLVSAAFGVELAQAALLVVVVLSLAFVLFVSLSTAVVFESPYSTVVGAFSGLLFLPITTLSTYLLPHAMSQAILFSSITVYLLLVYARGTTALGSVSALGALFAISSIGLVFYHPQLAAHLLVAFVGICAVQYLVRRYRSAHPIADHRPIYGQTGVLLAAFLVWTTQHEFFIGAVEYAVSSAVGYFVGDGTAGETVESQGASLAELGASVTELFLKLFGPSLVFLGLAGALMAWTMWRRDGPVTRATNGFVPYFVVSLVGFTGLFALYFLGSYGQMYFRVLGLMLLLVTIVGAVAIAYGMTRVARTRSSGVVHGIAVVGFGALIVFSLVAVFPSPYIYTASPHVTEMSLSGHETAFDNGDPEMSYVGIRSGPDRYADATNGQLERTRGYEGITAEEIEEGIADQYAEDRYLVVTQNDRDREVETFQELRYSRAHLDSISSQSDVNRVQTNGEFELYHVRGQAE